ncbi:MAG TPA: ATP-dependent DNA helicase RecG [Roseiflexaceae bacterium]|nr:ATP-dependent DNA helicase RecG [Roseiflexaceae bacterium]
MLDSKDQIIQLGKVLAEEQRRGCDDSAAPDGLERFLTGWRMEANGALQYPPVQRTLELLAGYAVFDETTRRARVGIALEALRALFREQAAGDRRQEAVNGSVASNGPKPPAASPKPAAAKPAVPVTLDTSIEQLPGIGKVTAQSFRRLGVRTVLDMLYHFPHRYDDYSSQKQIANLEVGAVETVIATVTDIRTFGMKAGGQALEVLVSDESGDLKAVFFRQPWLARQFSVGARVVLSGKVTLDAYKGQRQISGPDWEPYSEDELIHTGRLVPVHPLTKGLYERNARAIIKRVVDAAAPMVTDHLPEIVRQRANLMPLPQALAQMHFPADKEQLERARRRLGFDEFLFIQLGVLQRKLLWQGEHGYPLEFKEQTHESFLSKLPFDLTGAQVRALEEIFHDMRRPTPMARLLQGDVGSGKTAVAAAAAVQAVANGFQAAIMAPTEILAEQHYKGLKELLGKVPVPRGEATDLRLEASKDSQASSPKPQASGDWKSSADPEQLARLEELKRLIGMAPEEDLDGQGVRVALLKGSLGAKERRRVLEAIANGDVDVVVGTHALITESVRYAQLGLVVVDEQHRFGVEQRQRLKDKGFNPHMLVMTATPIPRTLTLTIYGDLDTSVLDELPPGRQEIKTRWIVSAERDKAYKHLRREISRGRQAYVVCPLVDESEKVDLPSAEEMYAKLASEVFPELRVALIHGKMQPREKDEVMVAFRAHEFDILVATAVIEVGIDVPNATTMLIEGAERFGLAQLHQFRGRVGRGVHQSYCILVSDKENEVTKQRLEAMEQTRDGFRLAEIDLELRGPGEFFGTRQSGTPDLKVAQLADTRLLHAANLEARNILSEDPKLDRSEHAALKAKVEEFWADAAKAG